MIAIAKVVVKVVAATATKKIASGGVAGCPRKKGWAKPKAEPRGRLSPLFDFPSFKLKELFLVLQNFLLLMHFLQELLYRRYFRKSRCGQRRIH